jgi:hypothetical protein
MSCIECNRREAERRENRTTREKYAEDVANVTVEEHHQRIAHQCVIEIYAYLTDEKIHIRALVSGNTMVPIPSNVVGNLHYVDHELVKDYIHSEISGLIPPLSDLRVDRVTYNEGKQWLIITVKEKYLL